MHAWIRDAARDVLDSGFPALRYRDRRLHAAQQVEQMIDRQRLTQSKEEALETAEEVLAAAGSLTRDEADALTAIQGARR